MGTIKILMYLESELIYLMMVKILKYLYRILLYELLIYVMILFKRDNSLNLKMYEMKGCKNERDFKKRRVT